MIHLSWYIDFLIQGKLEKKLNDLHYFSWFQISIGNESAVLADSFTFIDTRRPVIHDIHPRHFQVCGGQNMTIYGQNFDTTTDYNNNETNPRVTIGGKECEVVGSSNTTIECLTPGHVSGEAIVVVHVPGRGLALLFTALTIINFTIKMMTSTIIMITSFAADHPERSSEGCRLRGNTRFSW